MTIPGTDLRPPCYKMTGTYATFTATNTFSDKAQWYMVGSEDSLAAEMGYVLGMLLWVNRILE